MKPVIFAVEQDDSSLKRIRLELNNRYQDDYDVICESTPSSAMQKLEGLKEAGREAAVLLSACWLPGMTGVELLAQAHSLYPEAKRGLLVHWDDPSANQLISQAMALNQIDAFGPVPWTSPDESFHKLVTDFLESWHREHGHQIQLVRVVGEQWDRRSYQLRDLLARNGIPYGFYDVHSEEGKALLEQSRSGADRLPVIVLFDGRALVDPTLTELANALNVSTDIDPGSGPGTTVDVVIAGAGPSGLSAAVYGASEGLRTVIVEPEAIGGQAGMSSRIRNYLGFPNGITGVELAERAYQQAYMFGADFIFTHRVTGLQRRDDTLLVTLSDGAQILSRTVILAMGVSYRRIGIPALDDLLGAGVFYGSAYEAVAMKGQKVFVVGGGNSAGQAALHLARYARLVTVLVRGQSLAATMSEYLIREIQAQSNLEVRFNSEVIDGGGEHRLQWLALRNRSSGQVERVEAAGLFVMIGATPHTEWLPPEIIRDAQGYILTGSNLLSNGAPPPLWPLRRSPLMFETSLPGIFAVGDVRHRAVKRVASAVGEGSVAISLVHAYLNQ